MAIAVEDRVENVIDQGAAFGAVADVLRRDLFHPATPEREVLAFANAFMSHLTAIDISRQVQGSHEHKSALILAAGVFFELRMHANESQGTSSGACRAIVGRLLDVMVSNVRPAASPEPKEGAS